MKNAFRFVLIFICVVAVLFGVVSCARWQWDECKKVGHGDLYCTFDMLRK